MKFTLSQLLTEFKIIIPAIQRDYAQGRKTISAERIRNSFILAILNAIQNQETLNLDFIYGSVLYGAGTKKVFLPLDGQQRLTTLILLHWYAATKYVNEKLQKIITGSFSYETRFSSIDFFDKLLSEEGLKIKHIDSKSPSQIIKEQNWFQAIWVLDPTVMGSLNMLDHIYETLKIEQLKNIILNENSLGKITFDLLDIENINQSDELYIRMNARGIQLTNFENIKAEIIKKVNEICIADDILISQIALLDTTWSDNLWGIIPVSYKENFDNYYLNLIGQLIKIDDLENIKSKNINFIDIYNTIMNINSTSISILCNLFKRIDHLIGNDNGLYTSSANNINNTISVVLESTLKTDDPTYSDLAKFIGIIIYMEKYPSGHLPNWIRFITNIIENTRIDDTEGLIRFTKGVKEITNSKLGYNDINSYLIRCSSDHKIDGFNKEQLKEEILKAKLFNQDQNWIPPIYKAETHGYLKGQIACLLFFCNITDEKIDQSSYRIADFNNYLNKFEYLFNEKGLILSDYLLHRSLLTIEHGRCYFSYDPSRMLYVLLDNSSRDYSWKRFLSNEHIRYNQDDSNIDRRQPLLNLLNDLNILEKTESYLTSLIDNYQNTEHWKHYFINTRLFSNSYKKKVLKEFSGMMQATIIRLDF